MTDEIKPSECPRAFKVSDDEYAVIVYARNPMEARRIASHGDVFDCAEEEFLHVERDESLDDLCGKPLRERQLELGWWFECRTCRRRAYHEDGARYVDGAVFCAKCLPKETP